MYQAVCSRRPCRQTATAQARRLCYQFDLIEEISLVLHHPGPHHPHLPQRPGLSGPLPRRLSRQPGEGGDGAQRPGLRVSGHRLFPGLSLRLADFRLSGGSLGPPPPHGRGRGVVEPGHQPDLLGRLLSRPGAGPGGGGGGRGLLRHPIAGLPGGYPAPGAPGPGSGLVLPGHSGGLGPGLPGGRPHGQPLGLAPGLSAGRPAGAGHGRSGLAPAWGPASGGGADPAGRYPPLGASWGS